MLNVIAVLFIVVAYFVNVINILVITIAVAVIVTAVESIVTCCGGYFIAMWLYSMFWLILFSGQCLWCLFVVPFCGACLCLEVSGDDVI